MEQFLAALQGRNWYAAAAIGLGALIWAWRRWGSALWEKIPDGWRWVPPMLIAGAGGFVAAQQSGADWKAAALASVGAVWGIALPAMGGHGFLKELAQRPAAPEEKKK